MTIFKRDYKMENKAAVVELADTHRSKRCELHARVGSNPTSGINPLKKRFFHHIGERRWEEFFRIVLYQFQFS